MHVCRTSPIALVCGFMLSASPCLAQKTGVETATTLKGHTDQVYAVALTPDGRKLATASFDATVRLWDLATGKEEKVFSGPTGHTKMILSIAVHPEGRLIASGGVDGSLRFWDIPVPLTEQAWNDPVPRITMLLAGPRYLAPYNLAALVRTSDKTLRTSMGSGLIKPIQHPGPINGIAFNPKNPTIMATGAQDGRVRVIDLAKNVLLKEILAHVAKDNKPNPVYTVAFSPDGKNILSSSFDHSLKLHDAVTGNLVREFKGHDEKGFPRGHTEEVYAAAFSPDGSLIASGSGGLERVIKIWKTDDGSVIRDLINPTLAGSSKENPVSHPGWIFHVRFLNNGRLVSAGDAPKSRGYLAVWNVADGKLLNEATTTTGSLLGFSLSADEKTLAIGCGNRGSLPNDFNRAEIVRMPGVNR